MREPSAVPRTQRGRGGRAAQVQRATPRSDRFARASRSKSGDAAPSGGGGTASRHFPARYPRPTAERKPSLNDVPLAVEFKAGTGSVVYTSFHNESQATAQMQVEERAHARDHAQVKKE